MYNDGDSHKRMTYKIASLLFCINILLLLPFLKLKRLLNEYATLVYSNLHALWCTRYSADLFNAPDVFFISFSLPCVHRNTSFSNGSGSMIMSGKNVTA